MGGHVAGQIVFVLAVLVSAGVLAGAVLWRGQSPRFTEAGDPVSRGREPRVLAAVVVGVSAFIVAAVLASWPTP